MDHHTVRLSSDTEEEGHLWLFPQKPNELGLHHVGALDDIHGYLTVQE